jgi:putative salt-induced outer membrane protein
MRILQSLVALTLFIAPVFADQITMKDGDRLSGEIVKKDGDTVTVKSKNFGTVTLKWDDIASVKTDEPINVALPDGKTVRVPIETQGGWLQVETRAVDPKDVVALRNDDEQKKYERLLHPGIFDLWTITGSLNIAGTKGNAQTSTLTTPFNFARTSNTSRTTAYFNSIRSSSAVNGVNSQTARAIRGGWAYAHDVAGKKIFLNAFNDYEYDKFQSLDLRVVIGGGAGYQVWKRGDNRLSALGGADWDRDAFGASGSTAAFNRSSAEFYWGDDFNYKLRSRTTLLESFRMFDNLSNGGEYRMNFDVTAATQITHWLNWNISLSDRYLSNPASGRKANDLLYSTGLGFSWAR